MKNIKDYLHLYLGCKVKLINDISEDYGYDNYDAPEVESIGILKLINRGDFNIRCSDESEEWPYGVSFKDSYICFWDAKDFKPILRPLASMTDEERQEFINICELEPEDISCVEEKTDPVFGGMTGTAHLTNVGQWAIGVKFLLSKHFDLFGLIPDGLAIDKTTLKTKP